jgi:hypothetical protein
MLRFFRHLPLFWAAVFAVEGVGRLLALLKETIGEFLVASIIGYYGLIGLCIVASFLASLSAHGRPHARRW